MNARQKGLQTVRRVKHYLEANGYTIEGPGYSVAFFQGSMKPIHRDYFGVFDLLSVNKDEGIKGHQVCSIKNKARNQAKMQKAGISGYLWCKGGGPQCDKYWVGQDEVEFVETVKI